MTADVFQTVMDRLLKRAPYRPFVVELAGGQRLEIDHPRAIATRTGVAVFLAPGGVPEWIDHDSVLRIIEDIEPAKSKSA